MRYECVWRGTRYEHEEHKRGKPDCFDGKGKEIWRSGNLFLYMCGDILFNGIGSNMEHLWTAESCIFIQYKRYIVARLRRIRPFQKRSSIPEELLSRNDIRSETMSVEFLWRIEMERYSDSCSLLFFHIHFSFCRSIKSKRSSGTILSGV